MYVLLARVNDTKSSSSHMQFGNNIPKQRIHELEEILQVRVVIFWSLVDILLEQSNTQLLHELTEVKGCIENERCAWAEKEKKQEKELYQLKHKHQFEVKGMLLILQHK